MIRKWIPLSTLEFFDEMHKPDGKGGFIVDAEKDGKTTEEHRKGIDFMKEVLKKGQKMMPILVKDNGDGTHKRLDGFKKAWAHFENGEKFIEAFVVTEQEYEGAVFIPYGKHQIRAWHGGLPKEDFPLFEGGERPDFEYDKTIFLYNSPDPHGLKIEVSECIHVHWGQFGRFRFGLGRRDFEALATAVEKWAK